MHCVLNSATIMLFHFADIRRIGDERRGKKERDDGDAALHTFDYESVPNTAVVKRSLKT